MIQGKKNHYNFDYIHTLYRLNEKEIYYLCFFSLSVRLSVPMYICIFSAFFQLYCYCALLSIRLSVPMYISTICFLLAVLLLCFAVYSSVCPNVYRNSLYFLSAVLLLCFAVCSSGCPDVCLCKEKQQRQCYFNFNVIIVKLLKYLVN